MSDLYRRIGSVIRDLREKRSLSQEALSLKIGEPANTISRWETGTYKPSAEKLEKLATEFGVSITAFFPDMSPVSEFPPALMSAMRGLKDEDLEEVRHYAEFRKVQAALKAKKPPK